jgi:mono/diheme cytochrome c family protein
MGFLLFTLLLAHDTHGKSHAPASSKALKNPEVAKPELGKAAYVKTCLACHGADGRSAPAKIATAHLDTLKDGELYWIVTNGIGKTMPAFKTQLSDADRWQVVHYLRALRKTQPHAHH